MHTLCLIQPRPLQVPPKESSRINFLFVLTEEQKKDKAKENNRDESNGKNQKLPV
jgi:hypothetical protein